MTFRDHKHPVWVDCHLSARALATACFVSAITWGCAQTAQSAPISHLLDDYVTEVAAGQHILPAPAPTVGDVIAPLHRIGPASAYGDGYAAMAGADRPSPRAISNALSVSENQKPITVPLSNLSVAMFQLLASHEIARSPTLAGAEHAINVAVPDNDPVASSADGQTVMPQQRSQFQGGSGLGDPRQQVNDVTSAFDASTVYGSDAETLALLRASDGTGRLRTGPDGGLMTVAGRVRAGDVRADENPTLQTLHALFVREHNRLADGVADWCASDGLDCSPDEIFDGARKLVTYQQQKIFYDELLPAFLGTAPGLNGLAPLLPNTDLLKDVSGAVTEFTAAAGRIGHTLVPSTILLASPGGPKTSVPLETCFFDATCLGDASMEEILYGAVVNPAEAVDTFVIPSLKDALVPDFGATFLIDLFATNINRGRDHGLVDYQTMRILLGLPDVPLEELLPAEVLDIYGDGDTVDIDLIVGLFSEFRPDGAVVGETTAALWALQFLGLAELSDFYAADDLPEVLRLWLDDVSMANLIARNTDLNVKDLGDSPFLAAIPLPPTAVLLTIALAGLALRRRRAT